MTAEQLSLLPQTEPIKWKTVRDDFNFCRLALFVGGDSHEDRFRNIQQKYRVEVGSDTFEAIWEVRHDPDLGLPGPFDHDVWLGLLEYIEEARANNGKIIPDAVPLPSHREFLRRIGKPGSGKYLTMLKDSIKRLTLTMFVTRKAFNCPAKGGYLEVVEPIHLLAGCAFKGDRDTKGGVHEATWIKVGEYIKKNLENGYIALLDVKYVRTLRGDITKQLYRFLSYRLWLAAQRGRDFTAVHWRELADYLAVTGWDSLSRAKKRLKSALEELREREYIDKSSDWQEDVFVFRVGDKFIDELRTRINAKVQYDQWAKVATTTKQLRLSVLEELQSHKRPPSDADERESILIRQATKIACFGHKPDQTLLERNGWTVEDAISLSKQLQTTKTKS